MYIKSLVVASAALTLVSAESYPRGAYPINKRNQGPDEPSCTDFTPFQYAGCFQDTSNPRSLVFSGPSTSNMTVETCVAFCKGNDWRYAGLEYYGECFCGASVNGPQVDESQCTFPCSGDSTETCGGNDFISVYQDPTFPTVDKSIISDYKSLGCYSEGTSGRSLVWPQDQLAAADVSVDSCLSACKAGGYSFAGVEFGQECYCGVVLGNGTLPIDSSNCNMPCAANSNEICGGRSTLNLYVAMDLESTQPCNGGSSSSSIVTSTTTSIYSSSTPVAVPTTSSTSSKPASSSSSSTPGKPSSSPIPSSSTPSKPSSTPSKPSSTSSKPVSTSSKPASSSSTSSPIKTSPTSTPVPTTSSKPVTTPPTSTKTTVSLCTSTVTTSPTATCEYKCGNWCSKPIPTFTDKSSCLSAWSSCTVQIASCFINAGFPASMQCFEFAEWCSNVNNYCYSSSSVSKPGCKSKYPPVGPAAPSPTVSTSVYTCPAATAKPTTSAVKPSTTSAAAASSTSCVPVPTISNICNQPHNPNKGYTSSSPVGGIALPCLTCNNLYSDYKSGNCFKLYTSPDTSKCPSYGRSGKGSNPSQGCQDACDHQYNSCVETYAQGCRNNKRGDNYYSAQQKCVSQKNDCYNVNSSPSVSNTRCGSYNSGWY